MQLTTLHAAPNVLRLLYQPQLRPLTYALLVVGVERRPDEHQDQFHVESFHYFLTCLAGHPVGYSCDSQISTSSKGLPNEPLSERHQRRSGNQCPSHDLPTSRSMDGIGTDRCDSSCDRHGSDSSRVVARRNDEGRRSGVDFNAPLQTSRNLSICWRVSAWRARHLLVVPAKSAQVPAWRCIFLCVDRLAEEVIVFTLSSPSQAKAAA